MHVTYIIVRAVSVEKRFCEMYAIELKLMSLLLCQIRMATIDVLKITDICERAVRPLNTPSGRDVMRLLLRPLWQGLVSMLMVGGFLVDERHTTTYRLESAVKPEKTPTLMLVSTFVEK